MLTRTLLSILSVSPKGRTTQQCIRSLENACVKAKRVELLAALDELRRRRLISIDRTGHWRLKRLNMRSRPSHVPLQADVENYGTDGQLDSVPLQLGAIGASADTDTFEDMSDIAGRPPFDKLLSYYETAYRSDIQKPVSQLTDQHGHQFQLFDTQGQWWNPASMLSVEIEHLPPTFRYALSRRDDNAVVIGYPLAMIIKDGLSLVVPIGLIDASISRSGFDFQITPQSDRVFLNPEWIEHARRGTGPGGKMLSDKFDAAEGLCFDAFHERLSDCLEPRISSRLVPDDLLGSIGPGQTGIRNAAALFLPAEKRADGPAADLRRLVKIPPVQLRGTALWKMMHGDGAISETDSVFNPVPLTQNQLEAAETAMAGPVTAMTAPPGTGKHDVIVSIIASALCDDKTILFAARSQQAVDAVEARLAELMPDQPVMVCANGFDGDRALDFLGATNDPASGATTPKSKPGDDNLHRLRGKAALRSKILRGNLAHKQLNRALSDHIERRSKILSRIGERQQQAGNYLPRLINTLRRGCTTLAPGLLAPGATLDELNAAIERDQKALAENSKTKDFHDLSDGILAEAKEFLPAIARARLAGGESDPGQNDADSANYRRSNRKNAAKNAAIAARQVLARRPVWAVTTASASSRLPLVPGLFDYVIIDEASQCDIASALPLMARAKRTLLIGDRGQTESVPCMGFAQECYLLKDAGLRLRGMKRYAQSSNSLFGFCSNQPGTRAAMLCDQFRSAPEIVDYLNASVYDGRLNIAGKTPCPKAPEAANSGIIWSDVRGRVSLNRNGLPQNCEEARSIAAYLNVLIHEQDYQGSISVVSPIASQVTLLQRLIDDTISQELQQRASLRIFTSDRIGPGMRDMILFSPVAGPGLGEEAQAFLMNDGRLFSAAISQAVTVAHVFGDISFARQSGIGQLTTLAEHATVAPAQTDRENSVQYDLERRVEAGLRARGLNPTPQFPVAGRNLDFALFGKGKIKLGVEVDGQDNHRDAESRRKTGDALRDHQMKRQGWRVRRFWVHELEQDMEACLDRVERDLAG